jgi:hypothetical protein
MSPQMLVFSAKAVKVQYGVYVHDGMLIFIDPLQHYKYRKRYR